MFVCVVASLAWMMGEKEDDVFPYIVQGLNPLMFIFAIVGNASYVAR